MVWKIKQVTSEHACSTLKSTIAVAAAGLLMAACSSNPQPPTQQLTAAESAISHAEQARVADYASPELSEARDKLAAARDAVAKDEMTKAARYAEQAKLDADLATAKSDAAKAKAVNDELVKVTSAVIEVLKSSTPVVQ